MIRAVLCLLPAFAIAASAEETLKATAGKKPIPASVAPALQKLLGPESVTVTRDGKEIAQFWFRSPIPTQAEMEPATYDLIPDGTFVGVVELKGESLNDFRDQPLPTGEYIMRLGRHPQDGNHMGVAAFREFLCLTPTVDDKSPEPLDEKTFTKLSKKAAGTGHPAVLFIVPFFEKPQMEMPSITVNEAEHSMVNILAKATLKDGKQIDFPIAIVVIGVSEAG